MSSSLMVGGIEAGGTKFVCAVGGGPDSIAARIEFPTTSPSETIGRIVEFFRREAKHHPLAAIGIGTFGPVDLDPRSPTFGHLTSTPKESWERTDMVGPVRLGVGLPVALDTDVNAAALGEKRWGAARGVETFVYLTVGTGIGGGGMVEGRLIHGLMHPEMGHMVIPHDRQADPFEGVCRFHGDCLEGLACGPAMELRWGKKAQHLPPEHAAWPLEARYLALGVTNLIDVLSPQRVILGGGVMQQAWLLPMVQQEVVRLLKGYFPLPEFLQHMDRYLVPPQLGKNAGVLGALALALDLIPAPSTPRPPGPTAR